MRLNHLLKVGMPEDQDANALMMAFQEFDSLVKKWRVGTSLLVLKMSWLMCFLDPEHSELKTKSHAVCEMMTLIKSPDVDESISLMIFLLIGLRTMVT